MPKPKPVIRDAPWLKLTYTIIGLAMQVHNELGPGHRESVYQDAMAAKIKQARLNFEDAPMSHWQVKQYEYEVLKTNQEFAL